MKNSKCTMIKLARLVRSAGATVAGRFRVEDHRYLFWSVYHPYNFGDWVGPFLYHCMTGREPWFALPDSLSRRSVYMTAGSILGLVKGNAIVWGSGIHRSDQNFPRPWQTLAVRGPLSRQAFLRQGYPCPEVYGDPAILLPEVCRPEPTGRRYGLGLVPHFRDRELVEATVRGRDDVTVIDVRYPIEEVVSRIASCDRIASSSLHGLIVAHAYGVPAKWVFWRHTSGDGVKYADYFRSADVEPYEPLALPVDGPPDVAWLRDQVDETPLPDLGPLRGPLLAACPLAR
jgi:pyruvyltransferase